MGSQNNQSRHPHEASRGRGRELSVSEKSSQEIGRLLLLDYIMLSESCPQCDQVLMQDRNKQQPKFCVHCTIADTEKKKLESGQVEAKSEPEGIQDVVSGAATLLLGELAKCTSSLERNGLPEEYQDEAYRTRHKEYMEYINDCVRTIDSLRSIKDIL